VELYFVTIYRGCYHGDTKTKEGIYCCLSELKIHTAQRQDSEKIYEETIV